MASCLSEIRRFGGVSRNFPISWPRSGGALFSGAIWIGPPRIDLVLLAETVLPKHEQHKQALYRFLKLPLKVKSGGRHRPDREPILRRASAKPRSSQTIRISVVQTVPDTNLNLT